MEKVIREWKDHDGTKHRLVDRDGRLVHVAMPPIELKCMVLSLDALGVTDIEIKRGGR